MLIDDSEFQERLRIYEMTLIETSNKIREAEKFLDQHKYFPDVATDKLCVAKIGEKRRILHKEKPLLEHKGWVRIICAAELDDLFELGMKTLEEAIGE